MYRVIALGHEAGEIVDQLRSAGIYDDIRFVFCDTELNRLKTHGRVGNAEKSPVETSP